MFHVFASANKGINAFLFDCLGSLTIKASSSVSKGLCQVLSQSLSV